MAAPTETWDSLDPLVGDNVSAGEAEIRSARAAIEQRVGEPGQGNLYWPKPDRFADAHAGKQHTTNVAGTTWGPFETSGGVPTANRAARLTTFSGAPLPKTGPPYTNTNTFIVGSGKDGVRPYDLVGGTLAVSNSKPSGVSGLNEMATASIPWQTIATATTDTAVIGATINTNRTPAKVYVFLTVQWSIFGNSIDIDFYYTSPGRSAGARTLFQSMPSCANNTTFVTPSMALVVHDSGATANEADGTALYDIDIVNNAAGTAYYKLAIAVYEPK